MLMAYDTHVNYADTFAQVRLWDVIIYNYLRRKNIVLAQTQRSDKKDQYAGLMLKSPSPVLMTGWYPLTLTPCIRPLFAS